MIYRSNLPFYLIVKPLGRVALLASVLVGFAACSARVEVGLNTAGDAGPVTSDTTKTTEPIDPARPAAIRTESVPIVPQAIFDQLEAYRHMRSAGFAGWSPDGKGMLIRTRFAQTSQLHRVYEPGGRREQITFTQEPVRGFFMPHADDGLILASLSEGGNENYQLFARQPVSGTLERLSDGKSRNRFYAASPDGKRIIFGSNKRNGRDTDLYIIDPRSPDVKELLLEVNKQFWSAYDWSPDGDRVLLSRYVSVNESYPAELLIKDAGRDARPTDLPVPTKDAGGATVAYGGLQYSHDGKFIYATTDALGEFRRLVRISRDPFEMTSLSADIPWDVREVLVSDQSDTVVFVTNEDGASNVYVIENGKRRKLELPLGIVSSIELSPDEKHLGFSLAKPTAPADVYSLELKTNTLTRWTFSELGPLDPSRFVTPERIRYESVDGRKIPAYVFKPRDASPSDPAPVIINIHGGPESQYRPYFSSSDQIAVTELGAAVIRPNVRGSSGYGKTYLKLDNAAKREDSVRDIGALLDWIDAQPDLDGSRVIVRGGSYGGYMVLASLVHYSDRLRGGIDNVGIASFKTFLQNTADYRRDLRRVEYGDERDPEMLKVFERIDPLNNADKIESALMVVHGVNDPRVPFSEAKQIADRVRAGGREVWTVYAENEGHGFGKKVNRDYLSAVTLMFLKKQLAK